MSAKYEKLSKVVSHSMFPREMPSVLTINADQYPGFKEKTVGDICNGTFEARVVSIEQNDYRYEIKLEILDVESYKSKAATTAGDRSTKSSEFGDQGSLGQGGSDGE